MGRPQLFILGASILRSVILLHAKTLDQLRTVSGIGPEKPEKHGASILAACNV